MQIQFQTNVGQRRKNNQDAVNAFENRQHIPLALVADGMGGHQAGDVASSQVIEFLGRRWKDTDFKSAGNQTAIVHWLRQMIQEINSEIYAEGLAHEKLLGMGTTLVAAIILADSYIIANVGDSRCYLLRGDDMSQLTQDHSLVNVLVQQGELTPEMAQHHPRKNVLTRSIGMPGELEADITEHDAASGDILLLCTDGLTNMLEDERIKEVLLQISPLNQRVDQLVKEANEAGGADNITVLLIENEEKEGVSQGG